jgi:hypothetical protein
LGCSVIEEEEEEGEEEDKTRHNSVLLAHLHVSLHAIYPSAGTDTHHPNSASLCPLILRYNHKSSQSGTRG